MRQNNRYWASMKNVGNQDNLVNNIQDNLNKVKGFKKEGYTIQESPTPGKTKIVGEEGKSNIDALNAYYKTLRSTINSDKSLVNTLYNSAYNNVYNAEGSDTPEGLRKNIKDHVDNTLLNQLQSTFQVTDEDLDAVKKRLNIGGGGGNIPGVTNVGTLASRLEAINDGNVNG